MAKVWCASSAIAPASSTPVCRLRLLSANLLYRSYPRLTLPPLNVDADEILSAVVERLLKAMRKIRPGTVREFFALANQHMRWELNDLARRLDEQPPPMELDTEAVPAPASSGSVLTANARRMLDAIDELPDEEREAFGLLRIHGLTYPEAAKVMGVSVKTVQRRVNRSLLLLANRFMTWVILKADRISRWNSLRPAVLRRSWRGGRSQQWRLPRWWRR